MDNRIAGKRISQLRQARGMTQQQLAAMMNVSHQAVSKWESGLALPDIGTMLELTRFFGITVEELFEENVGTNECIENAENEENRPKSEKEEAYMNIQQLLQMAPFMSKNAVDEIAMKLESGVAAAQLAKLAPFISTETLSALIEKHKPQFSWDTLRKIAPYMGRDAVDALARAIASGEESIRPAGENLNKTFNDIGKAFDSIGKDMGQAFDGLGRKAKKGVKHAIRLGDKVINEVSNAFKDLGEDAQDKKNAAGRSEKALAIRKRAFERALADERWDWIALHIKELDDENELKSKIAQRAKELGMHDWICENMGGYADESTIKAAIAAENWDWLGENAWMFEQDMQQRVALAAMKCENWEWLGDYADQLELKDCALEIAQAALKAGERELAAELAEAQLTQPEAAVLAREACALEDYDALELLLKAAGQEYLGHLLVEFGEKGEWELVMRFARLTDSAILEKLMDLAVDQGNFDAIDLLDALLG